MKVKIPCPYCEEEININLTQCPFCYADFQKGELENSIKNGAKKFKFNVGFENKDDEEASSIESTTPSETSEKSPKTHIINFEFFINFILIYFLNAIYLAGIGRFFLGFFMLILIFLASSIAEAFYGFKLISEENMMSDVAFYWIFASFILALLIKNAKFKLWRLIVTFVVIFLLAEMFVNT